MAEINQFRESESEAEEEEYQEFIPEEPAANDHIREAPAIPGVNIENLDQQPEPANEYIPRPSRTLPGVRGGSAIYTNGDGFYYHTEKVNRNRR